MPGRKGFSGDGVRLVYFRADHLADHQMNTAKHFLKDTLKLEGVERSAIVRFALTFLADEVQAHSEHYASLTGPRFTRCLNDEDLREFCSAWRQVLTPREVPRPRTPEEVEYGERLQRFGRLVEEKTTAMLARDWPEVDRLESELKVLSINPPTGPTPMAPHEENPGDH